jgi:uncharacterized protein
VSGTGSATLDDATRWAALDARLRSLPGALVAFSGGVDSSMLLHACRAALGDRVLAVTADSPSLPRVELEDARRLAAALGIEHRVLETAELARPGYRENGRDRCYFCKTELFAAIAAELTALAGAWPVLYGAMADDVGDHRPGARAAAEHGVLAPLLEAGLDKASIRRYSRHHGLPTADKPSFACLASRIPYGTPVSAAVLSQLERAEQVLRDLGYRQYRVRHHGDVARVEILPEEFARAIGPDREVLIAGIRAAGYQYVSLDLGGYRTGSMNETRS